jgi:hypothetical protein
MKITRRISLMIILLGLSLLLGILFHSFVLDNIIKPVALVLWVFRRILLSVDQKLYWGLLIFSAMAVVFFRLTRSFSTEEPPSPPGSNATLMEIDSWRTSIYLTGEENEKFNILKQELGWMLVSLYALHQPEKAQWEIYEAIKQQQIPLPTHIYDFLFPGEPSGGKQSFRQILQIIRRTPEKWARRWTGRDKAEYYQSIESMITFMESFKDTKHEDRHFDTSLH